MTNDNAKSGVYKITCTANGKSYVGSSSNIPHRWSRHRRDAIKGTHGNLYFQNAWNVYGESAFIFEVIEYCERSMLIEREQFWIDELKVATKEFGFNVRTIADSNTGHTLSPETRAKLSLALKGRKHTPEHTAKVAAALKGQVISLESRAKQSATRKGRKLSPETIAKIVASNTGKKRSPESLARMRAAQKGKHDCPPEVRAKISASLMGHKQSPEAIEKQKQTMAPIFASAEYKAKMSLAKKGEIRSPETRKRMSEAAKKRAQKKREEKQ